MNLARLITGKHWQRMDLHCSGQAEIMQGNLTMDQAAADAGQEGRSIEEERQPLFVKMTLSGQRHLKR